MHHSNSTFKKKINRSSNSVHLHNKTNTPTKAPECPRSNQKHVPSLANLFVATPGRYGSVLSNTLSEINFVRLGLVMFFAIVFAVCN